MFIDAANLEQIHGDLVSLSGALETLESTARTHLGTVDTHVETVVGNWGGARPRNIVNAIDAYLGVVRPYPDALAAARGTLDTWATAASEAAGSMRTTENRITNLEARLGTDAETPADRGDLSFYSYQLEEKIAEWKLTCSTKGTELDTAIQAIKACTKEMAFPPPLLAPSTGEAYAAELTAIAGDLGAFEYTGSEEESVETPLAAGGFFIGWLLDPYHDTVVYAIAGESGASPGQGCKLDNGTFPDLCRPGTEPFQVGEVKYDTVWSMQAGAAQMAGYLQSSKNGSPTTAGAFMEGMRYINVGGVVMAYGSATGTPGLYFYRVSGFSVPVLIANRARAREHAYETSTVAAAIQSQNDVMADDPDGEFVPAIALAENSAPAGSPMEWDGDDDGGDGGLTMTPSMVPHLPEIDPGPAIATAGGVILAGGAAILLFGT